MIKECLSQTTLFSACGVVKRLICIEAVGNLEEKLHDWRTSWADAMNAGGVRAKGRKECSMVEGQFIQAVDYMLKLLLRLYFFRQQRMLRV